MLITAKLILAFILVAPLLLTRAHFRVAHAQVPFLDFSGADFYNPCAETDPSTGECIDSDGVPTGMTADGTWVDDISATSTTAGTDSSIPTSAPSSVSSLLADCDIYGYDEIGDCYSDPYGTYNGYNIYDGVITSSPSPSKNTSSTTAGAVTIPTTTGAGSSWLSSLGKAANNTLQNLVNKAKGTVLAKAPIVGGNGATPAQNGQSSNAQAINSQIAGNQNPKTAGSFSLSNLTSGGLYPPCLRSDAAQTADTGCIAESIQYYTDALLVLVGIGSFFYFLYGALQYTTAFGDEAKVTQGRNIIKNAIIGVVIASLAYVIVGLLKHILNA